MDTKVKDAGPKEWIKALWAEGDWSQIAKSLEGAAEDLVDVAGIAARDRVLDVAAGNGNSAIAAARLGARVTATDICPEMIVKGRQRSSHEGLDIEWKEADFEELPFESQMFDQVTSAFGVIFAMRMNRTLDELFRVTRPGGTVALVNWGRDGWPGKLGEIMGKYMSGGRRGPEALDWGVEQDVTQMLDGRADEVSFKRGEVWSTSESPEDWWKLWDANSPVMIAARRRLPATQYQCLSEELIESVKAASAGNGTPTRWASEYLIVTARKPVETK